MLFANVLIQKRVYQFLLGGRTQVTIDSFVLLLQAFVSLIEISCAGCISDQLVAFESEVVCSLGEQDTLKFLFVKLTRILTHLN